MGHLQNMLAPLPQLYREGELVEQLLALMALEMDIFDEHMLAIQTNDWFDQAYEYNEVAKLAALLDITPEPWQGLAEFRAWLHSLRNAWLKNGTVTVGALQSFVDEYTSRYQTAVNISTLLAPGQWQSEPGQTRPSLVENPLTRKIQKLADGQPVEPLHQQIVTNRGLDTSKLEFLLHGSAGQSEFMPLLVNLTTGQGLVYTGVLKTGERLWLAANDDGSARAYTDKRDVSDKLYSIAALSPGEPWQLSDHQQPAQALSLLSGENTLWFLPLAHYNQPGLDRVLLALADVNLTQGRWDISQLDQALFYQEPLMRIWASWTEATPAAFTISLPGGILKNTAGRTEQALEDREQLQASLGVGVEKIKAAGVQARTEILSFQEIQGSRESLCDIWPKTFKEIGPSGADATPDAGGIYGKTDFGDSVFR